MISKSVMVGNTQIILPGKPQVIIALGDLTVVLFDFSGLKGADYAQNVWALDVNGKLFWKIQKSVESSANWAHCYTNIWKEDDGSLWVINSRDRTFELDISNGNLIRHKDRP